MQKTNYYLDIQFDGLEDYGIYSEAIRHADGYTYVPSKKLKEKFDELMETVKGGSRKDIVERAPEINEDIVYHFRCSLIQYGIEAMFRYNDVVDGKSIAEFMVEDYKNCLFNPDNPIDVDHYLDMDPDDASVELYKEGPINQWFIWETEWHIPGLGSIEKIDEYMSERYDYELPVMVVTADPDYTFTAGEYEDAEDEICYDETPDSEMSDEDAEPGGDMPADDGMDLDFADAMTRDVDPAFRDEIVDVMLKHNASLTDLQAVVFNLQGE